MAWLTPQLDFFLQIRKGRIEGHKRYALSGMNVGATTTDRPIWGRDAEIDYLTADTQLYLASTSANDADAGTGAHVVEVFGLNSKFEELSEEVTLNGQTAVATANEYYRINGCRVKTAGSLEANDGTIYVGHGTFNAGVPDNIVRLINPGILMCKCAYFTVPKGFKAYKLQNVYSSDGLALITFRKRKPGGLWYKTSNLYVNQSTLTVKNQATGGYIAGTDVEFRGKMVSGTGTVTAFAQYILADERSG